MSPHEPVIHCHFYVFLLDAVPDGGVYIVFIPSLLSNSCLVVSMNLLVVENRGSYILSSRNDDIVLNSLFCILFPVCYCRSSQGVYFLALFALIVWFNSHLIDGFFELLCRVKSVLPLQKNLPKCYI